MKRRLILSSCLVALVAVVMFLYSTQSKDISVELQGTKYQLGNKNKEFSQQIKVKVNGSLHYSITGKRKFRGTIELEGEELHVPADQRELNIELPKDKPGIIDYIYFENGIAKFNHVGGLFINSNFTRVAFFLYEQQTNGGSWSEDNGLMLSAPANNREDASAISKELMKNWTYEPDFSR